MSSEAIAFVVLVLPPFPNPAGCAMIGVPGKASLAAGSGVLVR
jgi:hypothetical protein